MHKGRLGAAQQHDLVLRSVHEMQFRFAALLQELETFNTRVEQLLEQLDHESKEGTP